MSQLVKEVTGLDTEEWVPPVLRVIKNGQTVLNNEILESLKLLRKTKGMKQLVALFLAADKAFQKMKHSFDELKMDIKDEIKRVDVEDVFQTAAELYGTCATTQAVAKEDQAARSAAILVAKKFWADQGLEVFPTLSAWVAKVRSSS